MTSEVTSRHQFQHHHPQQQQQQRNRANFVQSLESSGNISTSSGSTDLNIARIDNNKKQQQASSNQVPLSATQISASSAVACSSSAPASSCSSSSSSSSTTTADASEKNSLVKAQQKQQQQQRANEQEVKVEAEISAANVSSSSSSSSRKAHVTQNQSHSVDANQSQSSNALYTTNTQNTTSNQNNMTAGQQQQQQLEAAEGEQDASKQHHVGPVMGIFFKVWSLVKVTKVRHNQRMRRQNSEDQANQFQYIHSPASAADQQQQQAQPKQQLMQHQHPLHHVLEDRHFRRAGSQPANGSTTSTASAIFRPFGAEQNGPLLLRAPMAASASSTGTNSTSTSGVSSATSSGHLSMLNTSCCSSSSPTATTTSPANNNTTTTTTPSPPIINTASSLAAGVKRHVSAYTSRRSTADTPLNVNNARKNHDQNQKPPQATSGSAKSWASKIKRSATSVNQTDFSAYMSRYRSSSRRDRSVSRSKLQVGCAPGVLPPLDYNERAMGFSSQSVKIGSRFQQQQRSKTDPQRQVSCETTSDGGYDMDNEMNDVVAGTATRVDNNSVAAAAAANGEEDEEEEDSNDIYSTPNDSIQSVPSTAPVICRERIVPPSGISIHQVASQAYPMVKSFSASNFGQLIQRLEANCSKMKPVAENGIFAENNNNNNNNNNSNDAHQQPTKLVHTQRDHQQMLEPQPKSGGDSSESSSKRLHDSRFFISSSSSEDSNSPAATNQPQTTKSQQQQPNLNQSTSSSSISAQNRSPYQLEQQQAQLALNKGVHYHSPTHSSINNNNHMHFVVPINCRPHSLLLETNENTCAGAGAATTTAAMSIHPVTLLTQNAHEAVSSMTPSNPIIFGKQVAAITPLDSSMQPASIQHLANNNIPPHIIKSTYRKSPSMMEISANHSGLKSGAISSRFSSKYPISYHQSKLLNNNNNQHQHHTHYQPMSSFRPAPPTIPPPPLPSAVAPSSEIQQNRQQPVENQQFLRTHELNKSNHTTNGSSMVTRTSHISNSISLYDYKQLSSNLNQLSLGASIESAPSSSAYMRVNGDNSQVERDSEYKLAQMLLESGSNPNAKDADGCTALMHAVLSDNLPAIKCLVEHNVNLNETNNYGFNALDLVCSKTPTSERLKILKLLIDNQADVDIAHQTDGSRLLDRLIGQHQVNSVDKLPFIDCLLQNGAKLGSSTWAAANGKHEVQLRLLRKLCQDGYYLYKTCSIEGAVYRFEYALKRIAELEQQLVVAPSNHLNRMMLAGASSSMMTMMLGSSTHSAQLAVRQIKYQTYLGLSRCERKRKFYKRALEFAHMTILVDSTSYEGYYSKAHILKDLGETDDALLAIDQTSRLVDKSIEGLLLELSELQQQEESLIFDGCFSMQDARHSNWIESSKIELNGTLEYLNDAKKYISKLKAEILDDKLRQNHANLTANRQATCTNPITII